RPLRDQRDLQFARQEQAFEGLVLADVRAGHAADLPGVEQDPEADAVDATVVGDDVEIPVTGREDGFDQVLRVAAHAEATGHQGDTVAHAFDGRAGGGVGLVHGARSVARDGTTAQGQRLVACGMARTGSITRLTVTAAWLSTGASLSAC